jgi:hypothetical protein
MKTTIKLTHSIICQQQLAQKIIQKIGVIREGDITINFIPI